MRRTIFKIIIEAPARALEWIMERLTKWLERLTK
jgi:hypothetical protein